MSTITLKLDNQLLTKTNDVIISSGDAEADTCLFTFDENWTGFTRTAVFYQDKDSPQYAVLDNNDSCMIPAAAMQYKGIMCIGVFGVKGTSMLTSSVVRQEILQGAAGSETNLGPSDDVFLAIVARYQAILDQIAECNANYDEILQKIDDQNAILETLNAFDVSAINTRMTQLEAEVASVKDLGAEFQKNFRINNVSVVFDSNGEFIYTDDRITADTLCDVFFDALCVAAASAAIITVETFKGYIRFKSTYTCSDTLTCSIYCLGV